MRIGINALGHKFASSGGVDIYLQELLKSFAENSWDNELFVFLNDRRLKNQIENYGRGKIKCIYFSDLFTFIVQGFFTLFLKPKTFLKLLINRIAWGVFSKTRYALYSTGVLGRIINLDKFKMDVIHFPFGFETDSSFYDLKTPIVTTIHDIQEEYYPDFFTEESIKQRRNTNHLAAERGKLIIAVSQTTKNSLMEKHNIPSEKIIVVHHGIAKSFGRVQDPEILNSVRQKYSLPEEFMMYPASTWPHKNHVKLLEALSILKENRSFEKNLVLAGIPMQHHGKIIDAIIKLNLSQQVHLLGFIAPEDLAVMSNLASLMVFPSLFEGFGIPLIEAMGVGLPIACSDRTSIPEVVGNAGIYFNPESAEDIAEKIYKVWTDEDLRTSLIERGSERMKLFSWRRTLEKTLDVYRRAAVT
jgi:glycosyltransferase involved in cell wall biosynthesis